MLSHRITVTLTAAAVAAATAGFAPTRAAADAGDFIGGVVTGVIGSAIVNEANRNKNTGNNRVVVRKRYVPVSPAPTPAQVAEREQNREMQTALNYFGFPAGTPDGIVGRNTRSAVSAYQAFMGYPATGQITEFEREILAGAYSRGIAGAFDTVQLVATDPMGVKALLLQQRDVALGLHGGAASPPAGYAGLPIEVSEAIDEIAASSDPSAEQLLQRSGFIQLADLNGDGDTDYILDTSFSGSSFWCSDAQCKTIVFASTPRGYVRNDILARSPEPAMIDCIGGSCRIAGGTVMASTEPALDLGAAKGREPSTGLPVFDVAAPSDPVIPLSAHCANLAQRPKAKGGLITEVASRDADTLMDGLFCPARGTAIENANDLAGALQGVTPDQIAAQCAAYGPALKPFAAALGEQSRDGVIRDVKAFAGRSGSDTAQLRLTAEICLGHGYQTDDLDVAIGSALLLVALDEPAYGELIGHHLALGYGVERDATLAIEWLGAAVDALNAGAKPVFATSFGDRVALLRDALFAIESGDTASVPAALPTFKIAD